MARVKVEHGVRVQYCGHNGWFIADIYWIEGACLVNAGGPVWPSALNRPAEGCDYHLVDLPEPGLWSPQKGIFAVPAEQVIKL